MFLHGIIEHFVIPDAAGCGSNGVFLRKPAIEEEGDPAFSERPVTSQAPAFQARQIMVCFGSADARQMVTDDDDVAFPIRGEVEFANRSLLLQDPFDPGQLTSDGHDLGWLGAFEAPNAHESA